MVWGRAASESNFIDTGDHRGSPLQAFVGAGLRACPEILHFGRLWRIPGHGVAFI